MIPNKAFHLVGYNATHPVENQPTFRINISPPRKQYVPPKCHLTLPKYMLLYPRRWNFSQSLRWELLVQHVP
jgi:hypothetical protein